MLFFTISFFSLGLLSAIKKLSDEGIGRLALVYLVSLVGLIIYLDRPVYLLTVLLRRSAAHRVSIRTGDGKPWH